MSVTGSEGLGKWRVKRQGRPRTTSIPHGEGMTPPPSFHSQQATPRPTRPVQSRLRSCRVFLCFSATEREVEAGSCLLAHGVWGRPGCCLQRGEEAGPALGLPTGPGSQRPGPRLPGHPAALCVWPRQASYWSRGPVGTWAPVVPLGPGRQAALLPDGSGSSLGMGLARGLSSLDRTT